MGVAPLLGERTPDSARFGVPANQDALFGESGRQLNPLE
jgi:hypothetical protein